MTLGLTLTKRGRRVLRLVPGLLALLALAGGGWLWFRDSGLVKVRDVAIAGVTSSDGEQVKAALTDAAQSMTTLDVRTRTLEDAVARYPSVRSLVATPGFPHKLTIRVTETPEVSQPAPLSEGRTVVVPRTEVQVDDQHDRKLGILQGSVTLRDLVASLNALGIGPRDMISILQSIKAAGALQADLQVR